MAAHQLRTRGDDAQDVIEVIGNPTRQAPASFHLVCLAQLVFCALLGGDVASYSRCTHDVSICVADWRNRKRYVQTSAVFCHSDRFEILHSFPMTDPFENLWNLIRMFLRCEN